ncbi:MAG: hypothetical protein AAFU79_22955, partial [Myxococcota bacterium]
MKKREDAHPSHYALDRLALGLPTESSIVEHLKTCPRCSVLVERRRLARSVPQWVSELPATGPRRRRERGWTPWVLSSGLAAAAALLSWLGSPALDDFTTRRGSPTVGLYVKRADQVTPWDGSAVRPGDRLRVEVAADGFTHVGVFGAPTGEPQAMKLLYASAVAPDGAHLLPAAWEVDGH